MNQMIVCAMLITALLLPSTGQASDLSGTYNSTEGIITLHQDGDRVKGRYATDNGEITGVAYDNVLEGFWIEDNSASRCTTPKNGRYYWGRLTLEFTDAGFSGSWGYCNDAPSRPWTGTRTSRPVPPTVSDDGFTPPEPHGGAFIEGIWKSSEGDISFQQQGNRISGSYPQDNGEIVGTMQHDTLHGYWIEDNSAQRCATPQNGRYFWGKIQLHFTGNSFSGQWGYCNDRPSKNWTGQRK